MAEDVKHVHLFSKSQSKLMCFVRLLSPSSKRGLFLILLLAFSFILKNCSTTAYYSTSDSQLATEMLEDFEIAKIIGSFNQHTKKRSCIKRGAICDMRPQNCCNNSLCKCNLWGTNCRCQRMGLFQRWGRK